MVWSHLRARRWVTEPWHELVLRVDKEFGFFLRVLGKQELTETLLLLQEYQQYKILIIDKPLSPKYQPEPAEDSDVHLSKINSLSE
jgi:hypothetical protein